MVFCFMAETFSELLKMARVWRFSFLTGKQKNKNALVHVFFFHYKFKNLTAIYTHTHVQLWFFFFFSNFLGWKLEILVLISSVPMFELRKLRNSNTDMGWRKFVGTFSWQPNRSHEDWVILFLFIIIFLGSHCAISLLFSFFYAVFQWNHQCRRAHVC